MHKVYLGLGSNMSNPLKQLKDAIFSINNIILKRQSLHVIPPLLMRQIP